MRLAILIPNFSTAPSHVGMLERALDSIKRFEPGMLPHTFVIDDRSPSEPMRAKIVQLCQKYNANLILKIVNKGYSHTVNVGIKLALRKEYNAVLTMNSDIELLTPFLVEVLCEFKAGNSVVGGKLLYPTGRIQSAGFEITASGFPFEYDKNRMNALETGAYNKRRFVMGVTGAFQAFRIDNRDDPYYSEAYSLSYEDIEFCCRSWASGHKVVYDPDIEVLHSESSTRTYRVGAREFESMKRWIDVDSKTFDLRKIKEKVDELNAC